MTFPDRSFEELLAENNLLKQKIQELHTSEDDCKRAEVAMRVQKETLAQVLNGLDALVYVADMNTHEIIFINTYGQNIWGDVRGQICWQTLQKGQAGPCEFCTNSRLVSPAGKPTAGVVWEFQNTINKHWYDCRDRAIYWSEDRLVRMEIATDITERKREEAMLQDRVKELTCLYGISSLVALPGIALEEILKGAVLLIPVAWQYPEITEASIVLEGKAFQTAHFRKTSWMLAADIVVHGKPVGHVEVGYLEERPLSDEGPFLQEERRLLNAIAEKLGRVAERMEAEAALLFKDNIIEHSSSAVATCDLAGKMTYGNPAFLKTWGFGASQEFLGRYFGEFWLLDDRRAEIMQTLHREGLWMGELKAVRKDGNIFYVQVSAATVYNSAGKPVALTSSSVDITERKRVEEERRKLQERLQNFEKIEIIGKLAGRVAHDLNNILGVALGYAELLTELTPVGNPLREYAANILTSSKKAAAIIEDLLTLARKGVRVMEVTTLNKIVTDLLAMPEFAKLTAYHPAVAFEVDLAPDLLNIHGSPSHIAKAIMNLVSNAVAAIVDSGEVQIKTENRYLDRAIEGYETVPEGEYAVVTVSDTGKGIPVSDLKAIFTFYTRKSMAQSGTGLGLAIVQGVVKDHKGYLDVSSVEEQGAAFVLYFPVTRAKVAEAKQEAPLEQYRGHGETVLVVDDVQEQRELAASLLTQLGYAVNAVASGEAAVEYLKSNDADILLLDMIMEPGMDGLDAYKLILENNPHQKAVIVSGFSETDRTREAQQLGAGEYIKKPYLKERLGIAIRDELAKK